MGKSAYEKALDEFYQIEDEDEKLKELSEELLKEYDKALRELAKTSVFEELSDEEKEELREIMGNEFKHAENHFTKNKNTK